MHALDWLGDLIVVLGQLIPRIFLVKQTHAAVIFTRAKTKAVKPGLHVYWPIWSEVKQICVVRQTVNLPYQTLTTKDKFGIVVAVTVIYTINDPLLALSTTDDIIDTIQDIAHWAVKRVVTSCDVAELLSGRVNNRKLDSVIRCRLQSDLNSYGVGIKQAFISEICLPYLVRVMSDITSN